MPREAPARGPWADEATRQSMVLGPAFGNATVGSSRVTNITVDLPDLATASYTSMDLMVVLIVFAYI